jgi:hypothetical protein
LTKDSGNDICLKRDGTLCVIFVTEDDSNADSETLQMLNNIGQDVTSKISRGIQFNFMWLNAKDEPEFAKTLEYEEGSGNQIRILNSGKRKRFLKHEAEITPEAIE